MRGRDCFNVLAGELVGSEDGLLVPVGPVDVILERRNRERMAQVLGGVENDTSAGSVVVAHGNLIQFGIDLCEQEARMT